MVAAYPSNYLLLLLVIVVGTASVAQANITIAVNVSGVIVNGVIAYTANPTIKVTGINLTLSCDGGNTTIGTSAFITGRSGAFQLAATTTPNGTLFGELTCAVRASIVNQGNVSLVLSAPLRSLTIQAGVELQVVNGRISLIPRIGSSIAIYLPGTFVPVALS